MIPIALNALNALNVLNALHALNVLNAQKRMQKPASPSKRIFVDGTGRPLTKKEKKKEQAKNK